ncbi:hypothetical protein HanXRQr2_Chr09g0367551 [Helianthus annuus]|uniref:Uncharacterized protein n=1 Tax=Helianthus annuus TaxID=4232 RepID=A0A9K3I2S3_HELAN|nr:hypothetical protein HanXRQr2_Chr09g0367551 [Helianthus annuus]KAJ0891458.1 hypothetical protein HanPSC8_Chr09g0354011 [Helianthus annuus]
MVVICYCWCTCVCTLSVFGHDVNDVLISVFVGALVSVLCLYSVTM